MLIFEELKLRPKDEVMKIKEGIILSEDEEIVFDMTLENKSALEIARKIYKSERTVFYIKTKLKQKIINYMQYQEYCRVFDTYGIDLVRT